MLGRGPDRTTQFSCYPNQCTCTSRSASDACGGGGGGTFNLLDGSSVFPSAGELRPVLHNAYASVAGKKGDLLAGTCSSVPFLLPRNAKKKENV